MSEQDAAVRYRVKGSNGAVVRSGCEMDSALSGELSFGDEVLGVESRVASNGLERIRVDGDVSGWVSLRLLEPAGAGGGGEADRRLVVEWREGPVTLRRLALTPDRGATCGDLKKSLAAMTRIPTGRQTLASESSKDPPAFDPERRNGATA